MHPRHVSQCLACQAARHPLQRALSPQTFPSNNVVKTGVVIPFIPAPNSPGMSPRVTPSIFTLLFLPLAHHFYPFYPPPPFLGMT